MKHQKPTTPPTPLQAQVATVKRLRAVVRKTNSTDDGAQLENEELHLGKMFADWCEKAAVQP